MASSGIVSKEEIKNKHQNKTEPLSQSTQNEFSYDDDFTFLKDVYDQKKKNDDKLNPDEFKYIPMTELRYRGICGDHIKSGNQFIDRGIEAIMRDVYKIEQTVVNKRDKTEEDKKINTINFNVKINNVYLTPPTTTHYASSREEILTPKTALLEDKTYGASLWADYEVIATAVLNDNSVKERRATVKKVLTASPLPIQVRGNLCNTYNKSKETLLRNEEDPSDPGGYFIVKGIEELVVIMESSAYNYPRIFRNEGFKNEVAYLTMISIPEGMSKNSSQSLIKILSDGRLLVIIDHVPFKEVQIPFYALFKLLGWFNDKQIVHWITRGMRDHVGKYIEDALENAYNSIYPAFGDASQIWSRDEILRMFISKMPTYAKYDITDEKTAQFVYTNIMNGIDNHFMPHIGKTAAFRHEKAMYLTYLIRKTFLVEMKMIPGNDRDTFKIKRVHSSGVSMAKAFKQQFNFAIVMAIRNQLKRDAKSTTFSKIDLAQSIKFAVDPVGFGRNLSQAITVGAKSQITIKSSSTKMTNHLVSNPVHRKNTMNHILSMREITIASSNTSKSKQSSRAKVMRMVHPSHTGFLCPIQVMDGPNVGHKKQMAISTSITGGSSAVLLESFIKKDPDFILKKDITPEQLSEMSVVQVNGKWIGCVKKGYRFADKYRYYRRQKFIDPYTTIHWDILEDELLFWCDPHRMCRPLLIVYNNYGDNYTGDYVQRINGTGKYASPPNKDMSDFKQWITLTQKHIDRLRNGEIDMEYLLDRNIIEYISPAEQENLYLAVDYDKLKDNETNPLKEFTHCDIPIAGYGLAALSCPFAEHNNPIRTIFQTQQRKQTCGYFSMAWPFRCDKEAFLQDYCEYPITKTISSEFVFPDGQNLVMAIQIYGGYNQEDSLMVNKSAVERGLLNGVHFTFIKTELDKGEHFGNPDSMHTSEIKPYASYEKIVDGFIKKGTIVYKNDVILGKYFKRNKPENGMKYIDRSIVYKKHEPAEVYDVIVSRNQDGKAFAKVQLLILGDVQMGDKFSQRSGQKGVVGMLFDEESGPHTEDGIVPDIIFNPFSFPSRMTTSTLKEVIIAKVCALIGFTIDVSIFKKLDITYFMEKLGKLGYRTDGCERMYVGRTGKWIDTRIFTGPMYYQRLQKFPDDTIYAVSHGSSDVVSRQPLEGKSSNGGLRIGEMAKDCIEGDGNNRFLAEKMFSHSNYHKRYVCRGCGYPPIVNAKKDIYICKRCGDNADIAWIHSSWVSKLLFQELNGMNIGTQIKLEPREEYTFDK